MRVPSGARQPATPHARQLARWWRRPCQRANEGRRVGQERPQRLYTMRQMERETVAAIDGIHAIPVPPSVDAERRELKVVLPTRHSLG